MQIIHVKISNYRNLDGVTINFDPKVNFIVGENELGKSNLLALLDAVFNRHQFIDDDFKNKNSPIIIHLELHLSETEKGAFEDYFDPDDNNILHIIATQEYSDFDERISYFWTESNDSDRIEIPYSLFRRVNYIFYDSLKSPQQELTFYKGRGSGKFLGYLINRYANSGSSINIDEAMSPIISAVQSVIDRLRPLKRQGLGLFTDKENPEDLAARVLKLNGQDGFDLQKSGHGVQFSALLLLTLMERLVELKQNKQFRLFEENREFFTMEEFNIFHEMYLSSNPEYESIVKSITRIQDDRYFIELSNLDDEIKNTLGNQIIDHIRLRKHISLLFGLDEPEIHLHPYMQRSLIRYVCELTNNKEMEFLYLIKSLFDIDLIDGQVLIVSHSPAILLDQYKHIIRFCKENTVVVISGSSLNLDRSAEKHLLLNFPFIKEAFFCRCVIVVEGETELGAFPLWANKVIGNLDDLGITILKVGGNRSVPHVVSLLNHFKIPNVSIIDKDDDSDKNPIFTSVTGLRTTQYRDIEEELCESIFSKDIHMSALFDFQENYDELGVERVIQTTKLAQIAQKKYKISQTWDQKIPQYSFREIKLHTDQNLIKTMFLAWMDIEKTITLGRAIGDYIDGSLIPLTFQHLFEDAKLKVMPK
jgi:putative ATP-dependent endonuclease of OLD family